MGLVEAIPFTLVLFAFAAVKSGMSGLEMVHACMPEVIQPTILVCPEATAFGFATRTIEGRETCTLHCAAAVRLLLAQEILYEERFDPVAGAATKVDTVPERDAFGSVKPVAVTVPAEHEYVSTSGAPTSATCGWHDICAVGAGPVPSVEHFQPVVQLLFVAD
jgi:hypothetical protein